MVCIQYFLAYLTSEYGAGYLGDRKEVFGWHIWKCRRPQGISYDTWGDAENELSKNVERGLRVLIDVVIVAH